MIIAVDFDGTIVKQNFPEIGEPVSGIFEALKKLQQNGHKLILWTCREDVKERNYLTEAVDFCAENGLMFDAINDNLPDGPYMHHGNSRKIFADVYVDDHGETIKWLKNNDFDRGKIILAPDKIEKAIADFHNLTIGEMLAKTRKRVIVEARQFAMYFEREYTLLSLHDIGRRFKKEHCTVIYSVNLIDNLKESDRYISRKFDAIKEQLINL